MRITVPMFVAICCLAQESPPKPPAARAAWFALLGDYGPDTGIVNIHERDGRLTIAQSGQLTPLDPGAIFLRGPDGEVTGVRIQGATYPRRPDPAAPGRTFRIVPVRPVAELQREALAATPPIETGPFLPPDLAELVELDPTIRLDIRYATTNNFMSAALYRQARAFLQRPAAEAVVRAHRKLRPLGFGLLIHDAYRPWFVTRMFWDGTPPDKHGFVADPAKGSRHNRGCAADLTLFHTATGLPVEMPGGYDEMSPRSYPTYQGGTSLQRWHRDLLRRFMEAEGFHVNDSEWWHFDYRDWEKYPILNQRFEDL